MLALIDVFFFSWKEINRKHKINWYYNVKCYLRKLRIRFFLFVGPNCHGVRTIVFCWFQKASYKQENLYFVKHLILCFTYIHINDIFWKPLIIMNLQYTWIPTSYYYPQHHQNLVCLLSLTLTVHHFLLVLLVLYPPKKINNNCNVPGISCNKTIYKKKIF